MSYVAFGEERSKGRQIDTDINKERGRERGGGGGERKRARTDPIHLQQSKCSALTDECFSAQKLPRLELSYMQQLTVQMDLILLVARFVGWKTRYYLNFCIGPVGMRSVLNAGLPTAQVGELSLSESAPSVDIYLQCPP
jgi:hypothetical protein